MTGLVGVHQLLQKGWGVSLPVVDDYLDPLLAMPVLLQLLLLERQILFRKGPAYRFPGVWIIGYTVLIAVLAEGIFPLLQPRFIADPVDVLLYGIGAAWFYDYANTPAENPAQDRSCSKQNAGGL